jgi:hypothetical protein
MSRVRDPAELTCKEIVELVTEYQSRALEAEDCARFEQHLFGCTWCMTYFKQMDRTIAIIGSLRSGEKPVDAAALGALFRCHREKRKGSE